ncbi:MAG TPA: hypothetical protein VK158_06145 [Acidobacteriota bacterium]|nr:hypothetical protein [Acidobacteriota bacterium]
MVFIRVKTISGKKYAYSVESVWKKVGTRQKVKGYLGKVYFLSETPALTTFDLTKPYAGFLDALLVQLGFTATGSIFTRKVSDGAREKTIVVDLEKGTVRDEDKAERVLAVNDGYLCTDTLTEVKAALEQSKSTTGEALAQSLVNAGFRIAPECFVAVFQAKQTASK